MGLDGRVGIVTGGGKGLGRAFALHLAAAGARVVVNNRNESADLVVDEIRAAGGEAVAEHSDVSHPDAAQSLLDTALREFGRLDLLVTSAGIPTPEMFHKTESKRFDTVIATNLGGSAQVAALCSRHMREAGFGRIVLVSSTAGLHGEPTASAYSASKGAIIALGRAIAVEGARRGVLTNVLLPYATIQMTDAGMDPEFRAVLTPEAVAPLVTALVDPSSTVNGQVLVCAGGGFRVASAVEFGVVPVPSGPGELAELIARSRAAEPREFAEARSAFLDFVAEGALCGSIQKTR
jgi:NAD(P)-dependent dehydrogenase (short-subunit alcohol dehydrogenase family)